MLYFKKLFYYFLNFTPILLGLKHVIYDFYAYPSIFGVTY